MVARLPAAALQAEPLDIRWYYVFLSAALCWVVYLAALRWPVRWMSRRRRAQVLGPTGVDGGSSPRVGNRQHANGTGTASTAQRRAEVPDTAQEADARVDIASRVVSTVHAIAVIVAALYLAFGTPVSREAWSDAFSAAFGVSHTRNDVLMISAGYMLFDLVLCLRHRTVIGDAATLLHHGVIIVAFVAGARYGIATFYMESLLLAECSTPFVNIRSFLLFTGDSGGRWYMLNGALLAGTFAILRVAPAFMFTAHIAWSWNTLLPLHYSDASALTIVMAAGLSALFLVHAGLNLYWFRKILAHLLRVLGRHSAPGPSAGRAHGGDRRDAAPGSTDKPAAVVATPRELCTTQANGGTVAAVRVSQGGYGARSSRARAHGTRLRQRVAGNGSR